MHSGLQFPINASEFNSVNLVLKMKKKKDFFFVSVIIKQVMGDFLAITILSTLV